MGEETSQFATRFSRAVALLDALARDDRALRREHGPRLGAAVGEALDAVEAVYATGTGAVRDWPERSRRVLDGAAAVRRALSRDGADAEVRRLAGALVTLVGPGPRGAR